MAASKNDSCVSMAQVEDLIRQLYEDQPEGFTADELGKTLGRSAKTVRGYIKRLIEAGKMRYGGTRVKENICGNPSRVPVYVLEA